MSNNTNMNYSEQTIKQEPEVNIEEGSLSFTEVMFKDLDESTFISTNDPLKAEDINPSESSSFFDDLAKKQLEFRCIRHYYKTHRSFEKDRDLNLIAWYVIEQHLNKDPTEVISTRVLLKYQQFLTEEFPCTDAGVWFIKSSGGKNARGKLYDAYNDWKTRLRSSNLRCMEKTKKQCTESNNVLTSEAAILALERLRNEIIVDQLEQIKQDWKLTYDLRREELLSENSRTVFEKYPLYKSVLAREMIIQDAETVLNSKNNFTRFKFIHSFLLNLLENKKSKTEIEKNLSLIAKTVPDNKLIHVVICLLTLSSHITSTVISLNKKAYKPSKKEIQDGFYAILKDKSLQNDYEQKLASSGVFIYSIGEITDIFNVETIVNVFSHRFTFKNVIDAFDFAFKCFHGLNVKYPRVSGVLWYIIQKVVYGFESPDDRDVRTTSSDNLISKIKFKFPEIYQ